MFCQQFQFVVELAFVYYAYLCGNIIHSLTSQPYLSQKVLQGGFECKTNRTLTFKEVVSINKPQHPKINEISFFLPINIVNSSTPPSSLHIVFRLHSSRCIKKDHTPRTITHHSSSLTSFQDNNETTQDHQQLKPPPACIHQSTHPSSTSLLLLILASRTPPSFLPARRQDPIPTVVRAKAQKKRLLLVFPIFYLAHKE